MKRTAFISSVSQEDEDDGLRKLENPLVPYKSNTKLKKMFTKEEVSKHDTEIDAWTIVREEVFNITPFINKHPGIYNQNIFF